MIQGRFFHEADICLPDNGGNLFLLLHPARSHTRGCVHPAHGAVRGRLPAAGPGHRPDQQPGHPGPPGAPAGPLLPHRAVYLAADPPGVRLDLLYPRHGHGALCHPAGGIPQSLHLHAVHQPVLCRGQHRQLHPHAQPGHLRGEPGLCFRFPDPGHLRHAPAADGCADGYALAGAERPVRGRHPAAGHRRLPGSLPAPALQHIRAGRDPRPHRPLLHVAVPSALPHREFAF